MVVASQLRSLVPSLLAVTLHTHDFPAATVTLKVNRPDITLYFDGSPTHGTAPLQRRVHNVEIAVPTVVIIAGT